MSDPYSGWGTKVKTPEAPAPKPDKPKKPVLKDEKPAEGNGA